MATTNPSLPPGEYVDPAQAQGAQIPLQSFTSPVFPPQARGLKASTLTSDIKSDEYQKSLSEPYTIPPSPSSIESLTLELFSLGYPAGFLSELADKSPNLKSVVVYSQLFGGISTESLLDSIEFFRRLPGLRALHLLDVFARPSFFTGIAPYSRHSPDEGGRRGLMFLEINYTVQHTDADFSPKIQAAESPASIGPGSITCAFNISEADVTDDPEDPTNAAKRVEEEDKDEGGANAMEKAQEDGVVAFNKTLAPGLVKALADEDKGPRNLKVLNTTSFTLTVPSSRKVLEKVRGVMVLSVTSEVDDFEKFRTQSVESLEECENLEQVEVVANPSLQFYMAINNTRANALEKAFPSKTDMEGLAEKCKNLASFKANILRSNSSGQIKWEKKDGEWERTVKGHSKGVIKAS